MERDAAVITQKRTGIPIPQRKRHAHRLAAVIMLKRTGIFVPQRKLSHATRLLVLVNEVTPTV